MVKPKICQNTVQSVFQFYVALHLVFMDMREKVSQSLVAWSWFKRCLIGLPSVSLFLSVTMISTEISISEKTGHLTSCLTGCRECKYVILCSSETAWEEDEARKSSPSCSPVARQTLNPNVFNVSTDDNRTPDWKCSSGSSSLHSCFAVFTWVVITGIVVLVLLPVNGKSQRTRLSTDFFLWVLEIKQQRLKCNFHILPACFFLDSWECP